MSDIRAHYDANFRELVDKSTDPALSNDDRLANVKILKVFSEIQPPEPQPEPEPVPVPKTRWERVKAGTSAVWDNETTRVFIKAGGAFAGVAAVVYSTIHKDHVLERNALAQASQRPS